MRTAILLAAVVCAALAVCAAQDAECRWAQFKAEHNKHYGSPAEEAKRFGIFKHRLERIAELNAANTGAVFGVNGFSDLTSEEFQARYVNTNSERLARFINNNTVVEAGAKLEKRAIPTTWTTPYMTDVRDQGYCGSCWAFATMGAVEVAHYAVTGTKVSLAPQQLVDCDDLVYGYFNQRVNEGCDGGLPEYAIQYVIKYGAQAEADYPYTSGQTQSAGSCKFNSNSKVTSRVARFVKQPWDEATYDQIVYKYNALAVALYATTSLQDYAGGIYTNNMPGDTRPCTGRETPNHAVLLVGYGVSNGQQYWVLRNSWGTDWGMKGFFHMARGRNTCSLTESAGIASISAESPNPNPPPGPTPQPVPDPTCEPIDNPCGLKKCGSAPNGCGVTVGCGSCPSGQACFSNGTCAAVVSTATWAQYYPAGSTNDFVISTSGSSVRVQLDKAGSAEYRTSWTTSASIVSATWVSFGAMVSASAPGTIGLGMRLGQPTGKTDGLVWKIIVPSSSSRSATLQLCGTYYGRDNCRSIKSFNFPWNVANNFTVTFALKSSSSGLSIAMLPYMNGQCLTAEKIGNTIVTTTNSYAQRNFPNSGTAYLVASGAGKTFDQPTLITATTINMALKNFLLTSTFAACVADMINVPQEAVVVTDARKVCKGKCWCKGKCADDVFNSFDVTLYDTDKLPLFGQHYIGGSFSIPNTQLATDLAQRLMDLQKFGYEGSVLEGATVTVVAPPAAAAASAGLSAGAIAGIVAGSVVGGALVLGTAGFFIYGATRPEPKEPMPADYRPRNPVRKTLYKIYASQKGVDVINPPTVVHGSITARAVPQEVA